MFYLGISAFYHDSSIALIDEEGNFVDFKKEEWLSRIKGDKTFPRLALQELINSFNLSEENIQSITFYEKPVRSWISVLKHSIKNNPSFSCLLNLTLVFASIVLIAELLPNPIDNQSFTP